MERTRHRRRVSVDVMHHGGPGAAAANPYHNLLHHYQHHPAPPGLHHHGVYGRESHSRRPQTAGARDVPPPAAFHYRTEVFYTHVSHHAPIPIGTGPDDARDGNNASAVVDKLLSSVKRSFSLKKQDKQASPLAEVTSWHYEPVRRPPSPPLIYQIATGMRNTSSSYVPSTSSSSSTSKLNGSGGGAPLRRAKTNPTPPSPNLHHTSSRRQYNTLPPAPIQSAMKKASLITVSSDSNSTVDTTPGSSRSGSSMSGPRSDSSPVVWKNKSLFSRLVRRKGTGERSASLSGIDFGRDTRDGSVTPPVHNNTTRKAVRFESQTPHGDDDAASIQARTEE